MLLLASKRMTLAARNIGLPALVQEIDKKRQRPNLSSAIRLSMGKHPPGLPMAARR